MGENTVVLSYTLLAVTKSSNWNFAAAGAAGIHELMYQWNGKLSADERSPGNHHVPATGRTRRCFSPTMEHSSRRTLVPQYYLPAGAGSRICGPGRSVEPRHRALGDEARTIGSFHLLKPTRLNSIPFLPKPTSNRSMRCSRARPVKRGRSDRCPAESSR